MMESGSVSRVKGSDSKSGSRTQCSSRSISDLPRDILVRILLRLTVKRILVCKCVCKSWYGLISDPEFAKLHFDQAEVCPLLQSWKSMYLVDPEKHDLDLNRGMCYRNVRFKPDLIFQAPSFSCFTVNSCNGLLLLYFPSRSPNELLTVCNPITGELVYLPDCRKVDLQDNLVQYIHGFGFSSTSNEYKVLRIIRSPSLTSRDTSVEVHVLGTESWKDMGSLTFPMYESKPTYVNGFLYWSDDLISKPIVSFDVEKQCFRSFFVKGVDHLELYQKLSVGELGQELCVSGFRWSGAFHVWVMKDHCEEKVWSCVFSIDMVCHGRQLTGSLQPVKYLNDGSLLMFDCNKKALICIDPRKSSVRCLKVCGTKSASVHAIAYISSFVSLKQALSRQNVNVKALIRRKWFAEPERETRDVYVVEKDLCDLYSDSYSYLNHFLLEDFDSDSEVAEPEMSQEEIESEDEDQEIDSEDGDQEIDSEDGDHVVDSEDKDDEVDSEDEDREIGSEDGDHKFSSNSRDEDQVFDPEEVDSEDRNDDQEFDSEDQDVDLELDSEGGGGEFDQEYSVQFDPEDGDGEFDSEDRADKCDSEDRDEFDPEDEDHEFGLEDVNPELETEDMDHECESDEEFDFEDGDHEVDCDYGDEDFDYDDGDRDFDSD